MKLKPKDYLIFLISLPFVLVGMIAFFIYESLRLGWRLADYIWDIQE